MVSGIKKCPIQAKYIGTYFFFIKTQSSLTSLFIISTSSQIFKTKFDVFWTQTCRNWSKLITWTWYIPQVSHALKWFNRMILVSVFLSYCFLWPSNRPLGTSTHERVVIYVIIKIKNICDALREKDPQRLSGNEEKKNRLTPDTMVSPMPQFEGDWKHIE